MRNMCFGTAVVVLIAASAVLGQTQTRTYGWEDGATILGVGSPAPVDFTNVTGAQTGQNGALGTWTCPGPQEGSRYLHMAESPHNGTPIAFICYVQGLTAGQQFTASFYGYDTTASGSPSLRIWGAYIDGTNTFKRSLPTAEQPGNNEYTNGSGWSTSTWTFTYNPVAGETGMRVEVRLYSTPSTSADRTDYWVDNLTVTAPATATIKFPGELVQATDQVIVTDVNTAEKVFTLPGPTLGAGPFTYKVTALTAVQPTFNINTCKLYDTKGTASTTDDVDVTAGGTLSGPELRFHVGQSSLYKFTYTVANATDISAPANVLVGVQSGKVIITEIMHRPNNHTLTGTDRYGPWEWLEVKNVSGEPIDLDSIRTLKQGDPGNLGGVTVPAGEKRIIMAHSTSADWLTEWNSANRPGPALTAADLVTIPDDSGTVKPAFNNEDTLFLLNWDDSLLDVVAYRSNAEGWPAFVNGSSFFLEQGAYDVNANDSGANWKVSLPSANNSYQTDDTFGGEKDSDRGSPLLEPGSPTVVPPAADDVSVTLVADGLAHAITLSAAPSVAGYQILSLPTGQAPSSGPGGLLKDVNGTTVTPGYTLAAGGAVVNFTPSASGVFAFTYRAVDTAGAISNIATVALYVQAIDQVVITEILYNPANQVDVQWEWVEIYNPTAVSIDLHSLTDVYHSPAYVGNLVGSSIGPKTVRIIAPDATATGRTRADFLTEWARPTGYTGPALTEADVIWVDPTKWSEMVNSSPTTIRLYAADGRLLDAVTYDTVAPWPVVTSVGRESIALNLASLSSVANDNATAWYKSVADELLAYATPETSGSPTDSDVGSPVALAIGYPTAADLAVKSAIGPGKVQITLPGSDSENKPLTYSITALTPTLPTTVFGGITLTDPNNGNAVVTGGGTLAGTTGRVDLNLDAATTGLFAFTYQVSNGSHTSTPATVSIYVQKGDVLVTEIMYNPANSDTEWEWIEIRNQTGTDVTLGCIHDATLASSRNTNLAGVILPANTTVILAKGDASGNITSGRTGADFLAEWSPLTQVVWVADFPAFDNAGDTVMLFDAAGGLLDAVTYGADGVTWPKSAQTNGSESIYLTCGNFSVLGNDAAAAWKLSVAGTDGAFATPDVDGGTLDSDVGSPASTPVCTPPPSLAARKIFYNQSWYDGNKVAVDAAPIAGANNDDGDAIDPSKEPLMVGGGQAQFKNWTGYDKGINGLIYDINFVDPANLPVVSDFVFKNIGKAGTAAAVVTPSDFVVQAGVGAGGTTGARIIITFANGTLKSTWLQVDIGTGFGLAAAETHFWGNCAGDTGMGNVAPNILVNPTDEINARNNPRTPGVPAPVDFAFDINKDRLVNPTDQIYIRSNPLTPGTAVKMITR